VHRIAYRWWLVGLAWLVGVVALGAVAFDIDARAVTWLVLGLGSSLTLAVGLMLKQTMSRERYATARVERYADAERVPQAELEFERRALATAQAIAGVGSWSWEPATDRTQWSREMYRIFDRDPLTGPAASESFFAYLHPEDRERIAQGYARAFGAGDGFDLRYRIVLGEGEIRFLHGIGRREGDGRYVGTAQDVTETERMRSELATSREHALEASRLKSEFVANMSHEIRTPLNGVVSMSELLLDTSLDTEQQQYAQVALTSAEALMRVINDILDFSKIEAGKLDIVDEDYSIQAAADEVCEILGMKAKEKRLELAVLIDPDVPALVRGDGNRVRQILINLVGNAIKYTATGEIVVRIALRRAGEQPERLRIEIIDTGIGIEADRLVELFEPFSQADTAATRRYGGTGLGLSISKQLAELMGGEIGVTSTPGSGSVFWLSLPCAPGGAAETGPSRGDLTGVRALVVDDDAGDRQLLERQLAAWGLIPDGAPDGHSALELMHRAADAGRPHQVAVLDLRMPKMDGLELAILIDGTPRLRGARLILLSGSTVPGDEARAAGVDAVLTKPLRQSKLYDALVTVLSRTALTPPPPLPQPHRASAAPPRGRLVLVAEDNEINQFAARQLLEKLGFDVDIARNGREAVEMSAREEYAAVFMDCQMPEVDGYMATQAIRRREDAFRPGRHTPIVAMTAHTLEGDRERCLAAGMDDYIAKPLRMEAVATVCARHGELSRADAPLSDAPIPVFDPTSLVELASAESAGELLTMFIADLDGRLPLLADAIRAGDYEMVHELAHGLAGSAATVGAGRVRALCDALCQDHGEDSAEVTSELRARLGLAADEVAAAMTSYIADHSVQAGRARGRLTSEI
jgi:signal transduction histidine kinase/DNA-binding response OmpR family regulator